MEFKQNTLAFRIALTLAVLWLGFVSISAARYYLSLDHADFFSMSCPIDNYDDDQECFKQARLTDDNDYADAKKQVFVEVLLVGALPAFGLIALAGLSGSLVRLLKAGAGAYWHWLRNGSDKPRSP